MEPHMFDGVRETSPRTDRDGNRASDSDHAMASTLPAKKTHRWRVDLNDATER